MRHKAGHLRSVLKATDICLLQETHGSMQELGRIFNCLRNEWSWFLNPGASRSAGGTAVLIRKRAAPGADGCTTEVIIPGRVSRTRWNKDNKTNVIWNLHNFGLSPAEKQDINRRLDTDRRAAQADPNNNALWVAGDFNFPPQDAEEFSLRLPTAAGQNHRRRQSAEEGAWPALCELTELALGAPTHFCRSTDKLTVCVCSTSLSLEP